VFFVFVSAGVASEEVMGQVKTFTQSIGFLKIFDFRQSEYNAATMRDVYGPYEIYDESDKLIRRVGESRHGPRTLRLDQGKYLERGKRENGERVEFFVVIEGSKMAEVYSHKDSRVILSPQS